MKKNKQQKIIVGLSGGVDSAVTALLLQKAGYHVEGLFMKNWEEQNTFDSPCQASIDLEDASAVCKHLKIKLHCINFAEEYWQHVFLYFIDELKKGRTPNPDILCNKEIKFKAFLNYAKQLGADKIATGHYAKLKYQHNEFYLLKGNDQTKDQSYFLYALNQEQLAQSVFPIGHLDKKTVRNIAKEAQFINHAKKDSTGICFIGEKNFKNFLKDYLTSSKGVIETIEGATVGEHDGLMFYTIGQRSGLKIGGKKLAALKPWYVVHKDTKKNKLIVAQGANHPALFAKSLKVKNLTWINEKKMTPLNLKAKIRYRQTEQPCVLINKEDEAIVTFKEPERAITPGQSIVFYQENYCLGGGIIDQILT